eukprot:9435462-Pyramimonas_sp.AAC.1
MFDDAWPSQVHARVGPEQCVIDLCRAISTARGRANIPAVHARFGGQNSCGLARASQRPTRDLVGKNLSLIHI